MASTGSETFTLAATGDSIITRSVLAHEGNAAFDAVLERLRDADATTTNLEVVVADASSYATPPRTVRDQYQYLGSFPGMVIRSTPELLDELAAMGIDLYGTASNHSYDFGRRGMMSTMRALEVRNLAYAGLGRDLPSARSPAYVSTPAGRVGFVAACTSVAPGSEAGSPSSLLPGRPGISPLHVEWSYRLREDRLEELRTIGEVTGIDDAKATWIAREDSAGAAEDCYEFMHMTFESVESEGEEGIDLSSYAPDREEVLAGVREADATADWVVASLHAHQGPDGTRNVPETPPFLESLARDCIDAGADAFIATGPHVLRGIEVYEGKPIFYSLGNFFCQFETLDRLPAESFNYYDIDDDRYPSSVFDVRYYEDGEPTGNLAYPAYWQTVVPTCEFASDGDVERIELLPCSLGRERPRARRGTPLRATNEEAEAILDDLDTLSAPFGTEIRREDELGIVDLG
jgi:poly-gamma-glutamate capsule biosynthesis protein CapA/YwtB (metallophosphatase superfamily)